MMLHPDLLPKTVDPQDSVRYGNVNIVRLLIPCKEEGTLTQFYKNDNYFVVYDCSPKYGNQAIESFIRTRKEHS